MDLQNNPMKALNVAVITPSDSCGWHGGIFGPVLNAGRNHDFLALLVQTFADRKDAVHL
jgi:hypothetical protein